MAPSSPSLDTPLRVGNDKSRLERRSGFLILVTWCMRGYCFKVGYHASCWSHVGWWRWVGPGSGWVSLLATHNACNFCCSFAHATSGGRFFGACNSGRCYSSKTGYQFIRRQLFEREPSNSSKPSLTPSSWTKLWKANAAPRCRETAWRACLDLLLVRAVLHRRGIAQDSSSPQCLDVP